MKKITIIALLLVAVLGVGRVAEAQRRAVQLCPVHKVRLRTANVPVVYNANLPLAYLDDAPRYFPFANRVFYSGDVDGSVARTAVLYCSRCRSVERNWRRQYDRNRKSGGGPQPSIAQRNLFLQFLASQKAKQQQAAPRPRAK